MGSCFYRLYKYSRDCILPYGPIIFWMYAVVITTFMSQLIFAATIKKPASPPNESNKSCALQ